ncbi:hypothetical protein SCRM01_152c [Synechococcus phage S-CRM01]|nr:hypothetical protein SCRM01_152c [Synechococcus phage S-CRM01]AEC53098.1 hypothetical protein SCRM01_152c [Synechococcus phage S-CRM01]
MTIVIPVWVITLVQALGIVVVGLLAILGLCLVITFWDAKWWI